MSVYEPWRRGFERALEVNTKHGGTLGGKKSPEYSAWQAMLDRCYNPRHDRYAAYGGRGILVCGTWRHDFSAFLADMGPRPSSKHSLDRIDNDKGYSPDNCRWATSSEQMFNLRTTLWVDGVPLAKLALQHGIPSNTLRWRILKGWGLADALSRPVRPKRRKIRLPITRPTR